VYGSNQTGRIAKTGSSETKVDTFGDVCPGQHGSYQWLHYGRWKVKGGNEGRIAFNSLRNRSQSVERVETIRYEALTGGLTKNARHDVYLTTAVIRHGVEGMLGAIQRDGNRTEGKAPSKAGRYLLRLFQLPAVIRANTTMAIIAKAIAISMSGGFLPNIPGMAHSLCYV